MRRGRSDRGGYLGVQAPGGDGMRSHSTLIVSTLSAEHGDSSSGIWSENRDRAVFRALMRLDRIQPDTPLRGT
ncbi:hypothetical protein GCM10010260_78630 [Streptomyces filipinensis]|uniref:Uncharacterized protein n=1 Tax=Streptomyces filipinensis TaxID=66887 RepID=A0A918IKA8_9ACTN|nr:hypothetical protein GCM10010260_78630 [Streptomyces filipinensis]